METTLARWDKWSSTACVVAPSGLVDFSSGLTCIHLVFDHSVAAKQAINTTLPY